jgi:hypothetical protein
LVAHGLPNGYQDHVEKTVTFEEHPHTGVMAISIHPCRHASVMKTFIDAYESDGRPVRVDQCVAFRFFCITELLMAGLTDTCSCS